MPRGIAICIEDLTATDPRFTQCVALPGNEPGLTLDADGKVHWRQADEARPQLWVSGDGRLILYRESERSLPVTVSRGGRHVEVPASRPTVLIDGDELKLGTTRLRVHHHGPTDQVSAPAQLVPEEAGAAAGGTGAVTRAAMTALALGAAAGIGVTAVSASCTEESYAPTRVEVRAHPPAPPKRPDAGVKPVPPDKPRPPKKPQPPDKPKPPKKPGKPPKS